MLKKAYSITFSSNSLNLLSWLNTIVYNNSRNSSQTFTLYIILFYNSFKEHKNLQNTSSNWTTVSYVAYIQIYMWTIIPLSNPSPMLSSATTYSQLMWVLVIQVNVFACGGKFPFWVHTHMHTHLFPNCWAVTVHSHWCLWRKCGHAAGKIWWPSKSHVIVVTIVRVLLKAYFILYKALI